MIGELVRRLRLMNEAMDIIAQQQRTITRAAQALEMWQDLSLETTRRFRSLAISALIAQDHPEVDIREELCGLVRELDDQVARLEEHVCRD